MFDNEKYSGDKFIIFKNNKKIEVGPADFVNYLIESKCFANHYYGEKHVDYHLTFICESGYITTFEDEEGYYKQIDFYQHETEFPYCVKRILQCIETDSYESYRTAYNIIELFKNKRFIANMSCMQNTELKKIEEKIDIGNARIKKIEELLINIEQKLNKK